METKKVLVTGATGSIGEAIVKEYAKMIFLYIFITIAIKKKQMNF